MLASRLATKRADSCTPNLLAVALPRHDAKSPCKLIGRKDQGFRYTSRPARAGTPTRSAEITLNTNPSEQVLQAALPITKDEQVTTTSSDLEILQPRGRVERSDSQSA